MHNTEPTQQPAADATLDEHTVVKVAQIRPGDERLSLVLLPQRVHLRLELGRTAAGSTHSADAPVTRMVSIVAGDETGVVRVVLFDRDEELVLSGPEHALTTLPIVLRNCYAHVFEGRVELRVMEGLGTVALLEKETAGVPAPPAAVNTSVDVSQTLWEATALVLQPGA